MMEDYGVKAKLSTCSFGLALGILKGFCLMLMAWSAAFLGYGMPMVTRVAEYYSGYGPTFLGGVIGLVYGLVGGFIFGFLFAYIYNFILFRCCCKRKVAP